MKKKIVISILILVVLFGIGSLLIFKNKSDSKKNQNDQVEVLDNEQEEIADEKSQETTEAEETESSEESSNSSTSSNSTDKSKDTSKSNSSTSNSSKNDTSTSNSSSNNSTSNSSSSKSDTISQVPVWEWLKNDFPVSKYGSKAVAFDACDKKGEQKIVVKEVVDGVEQESIKYSYFCTDVTNVDGIFIGYMLRLKELNTGNDYNWR